LSEQAGQTDEIEGGHGKGELPVDLGAARDAASRQAGGDWFGPAEGLLDALANVLGEHIPGTTGGAAIDRRKASKRWVPKSTEPCAMTRTLGRDALEDRSPVSRPHPAIP
jgi:hypothetical protein